MLADMVIVFTCPGCNEANAFAAGIPRPGDELHCPVCGEIIVVRDEFINEFNTIMKGLGESVEHFAQQ